MALAVNDIVQLTDVQTYLGQTMLNVYLYEMVEVGAETTLEDIAQTFETLVLDAAADFQAAAVTHTFVQAKNLTNGVDIWEELSGRAGSAGGTEDQPSFMALGFRFVRSSALTRHGSKRIGGILEGAVTGNSLNASMTTLVDAYSAAAASVLEIDAGSPVDFVARPVIIGRFPKDDPDAGEYDLSKVNPVSAVQFIRVTTQSSRKAGRGI